MNVVIVESPAKAKTINGYLGSDYEVLASFGHVRDLPAKDGSVDPEQDFAMQWEVDDKAAKRLSDIVRAVKASDKVILATDPDREGEAISWHVLEVLRNRKVLKDKPVERVVFNAITKSAVRDAMNEPARHRPGAGRRLSGAARARLSGRLQPVAGAVAQAAGRPLGRPGAVGGAAARLRPRARDRGVQSRANTGRSWRICAPPPMRPSRRGSSARTARRSPGSTSAPARRRRPSRRRSTRRPFSVAGVEAKPVKRHPFPPFRTSTLQQEASRKLGLSPARTMQVAQKLYEGVEINGETTGLITYMRTDGIDMAPEAITGVAPGHRRAVRRPLRARRAAQIHGQGQERPGGARGDPADRSRPPAEATSRASSNPSRRKLYELIWKRTVASQMESAELERTTVDILAEVGGARALDLRATGQVVRFDGFLTLYGVDDDEERGRGPPARHGGRRGRSAQGRDRRRPSTSPSRRRATPRRR